MTLSATYEPRRQQGNGITKEFSYSFDPYSLEALRVYIEENGVQTETQDYTATANENGGIVTFNVAPTSEQYVVIARSVPQDQEVPFYTSSGFDAGVVENSLDKLTAMVQEVNNEAVRSAKLPKGYNINVELPVPESGKGLYWNNEGTGFQNSRLNLDDVETLTKSYRDQSLAARDEAVASSTRAVNKVKEATDLLANTQTYVGEAVVTINTAVDDAKATITKTSEGAKNYVDAAKLDIDSAIEVAKQEINTTVDEAQMNLSDTIEQAVEDVKNEAVNAADETVRATIGASVDEAANYAKESKEWAKGAEASAKLAAENAQSGGKLLQLGFDGSMVNGALEFKHAPSGTEVPYTLVENVEYEMDLAYSSTSSLSSSIQMYVKNGSDTIRFVSAIHREATTNATVADMDAVMRFNSSTGYRWLFKAAYKVTPSGAKVFLLYPVAYKDANNIVKTSGDQSIGGTKTFTSTITRSHAFSGATSQTITDNDSNGKGRIAIIPYYTGNTIYNRVYAANTTAGKDVYLDVTVKDDGSAGLAFSGSADTKRVNFSNATSVNVPTPNATSNNTEAATTAWVNSNAKTTITYWD